jgi:ABC-type lipoprotein export system ATPase subunit
MDMLDGNNKKQILFNSSGYAAHGETLAIMGPSGISLQLM